MAGKDFVQKVDIESAGVANEKIVQLLLAIAPLHPFGQGNLTTDGIQWSDEVSTTDAEWTEIEAVKIKPEFTKDIVEIEMALTLRLKSSGAAKFAKFKWQARNEDGTWVDLCSEQTYAADASAYKEHTISGRFKTTANFDEIPLDIRAMVQREDETENVTAQCKNSSYVMIIAY